MNRPEGRARAWECRACGGSNPVADVLPVCAHCGAGRPARPPDPSGPWARLSAAAWAARRATRPRLAVAACWAYLAATAGLLQLLRLTADRWWPTVVFLFGPRWVWAVPLAALVPLAVASRSRASALPLAVSALLLGPLLGYGLPLGSLIRGGPDGATSLRVLTCNVQTGAVDFEALAAMVADDKPDVVLLQECSEFDRLPDLFPAPRWHVRQAGGMAVASRFPVGALDLRLMRREWEGGRAVRCGLDTPFGPLDVVGVHLETPRRGLEALLHERLGGVREVRENLGQRWLESDAVSRWAGGRPGPVLIAGDFNMPVDSAIYRAHWSRYENAFSETGFGFGYTKLTRWFGIRIDQILTGGGLRCRRCWVGRDVGSDHRPLLADLVWVGEQ